MMQVVIITYGPGGHDPDAADDNIIEERTVEVPDDPQEEARQRFRDAVNNATSVSDLQDALLGTDTNAEPDVRPR